MPVGTYIVEKWGYSTMTLGDFLHDQKYRVCWWKIGGGAKFSQTAPEQFYSALPKIGQYSISKSRDTWMGKILW